jgi:negative regulator of sigma E activity
VNCAHARAQLAAYRRGDWSSAQMRALSEHLATCPACRKVETEYRHVGESLRALPTFTPDASFRDRVFAAIAIERERLGPAAMRASRATTEPSLPVVRAPIALSRPRRRLGPVPIAAMVAAAVLLVSFVAMQWVSGHNAANIAANIGRQPSATNAQSRLNSYLPDQRFFQVTEVRATRDWLAYVAGDGAGSTMLFVLDRHSGRTHTILTSPASGQVTMISLSAHWVTWSVTSPAGWTVSAAPLKGASAWRPQPIMQSATSTLTGAWANDSEALVAISAGGEATLQRISIASSATSAIVIATGSHQGAIIASPSMTSDTVYWADVWSDMQGSLHSAIWSQSATGAGPITQAGGEAYSPIVVGGSLLWISATHALTIDIKGDAAAIVAGMAQANGKLVALNVKSGQSVTLANDIAASSVRAGGGIALWTNGATIQGYALNSRQSLAENSLIAHAHIAGATTDSLAWFDGSHIVVYRLS